MTAGMRRNPSATGTGTIRPYTPADRTAVRDICCRTAFRNMGSDRLFEDRELFADYSTKFYTDVTPGEVRIVEKDGEVIGYFLGAPDPWAHRRYMTRLVPKILLTALWRWLRGQYKKPETIRFLRHLVLKAPKEAPYVDFDKYPATFHCNITRKGARGQFYSTMVLCYLDRLEAKGIKGIHGFITEPEGKGIYQHFEQVAPNAGNAWDKKRTRMFEAVTGDTTPMINHVKGASTADFRTFILWLRDTKGL
jgi:hypothetical protein